MARMSTCILISIPAVMMLSFWFLPRFLRLLKRRILQPESSRDEIFEVKTSRGFTLQLTEYQDMTFPAVYDELTLHMDAFVKKPPQMRTDDVWIINYPKSGTHFLWEIAKKLATRSLDLDGAEKESLMCPEILLPDEADRLESPRILSTHVPPRFFSTEVLRASKIIYLVRNPKDVFVSYYFHRRNVSRFMGKFEDFLELVSSGQAGYGRWIDHVKDWLAATKDNPNILLVKYENLLKEPLIEIRKIAAFLGSPNSETFYMRVRDSCSFENMAKERSNKRESYKSIFRKGTVGDWKNHFTVTENEEFEKQFRKQLMDLPFSLDFD